MAHSPETKAAVCSDLIAGMSQRAAAKKHGVSSGTVKEWALELKNHASLARNTQNHANAPVTTEARQKRFDEALEEFLMATMTMLKAMADTCADTEFLKKDAEGANELANTVLNAADRIVGRHQNRQ